MNATPQQQKNSIRRIRKRAGQINSLLPALLAFALPLSTSAISLLAILILLLWLIEGRFIKKGLAIFSQPVAVAVLAFLTLLCLGLLWTEHLTVGFKTLKDQWKLALLPVLLTTVTYHHRSLYLSAFLLGMTLAMGMTFLAWFDLLHYADVSPTHLTPKTFHVTYNPLLAFAIYLVLHEAIWGRTRFRKRPYIIRVALFGLAGLMTVNMFMTEGRTGQVVFLVLISLLLLQIFRKNRLKAAGAILLVLPVICLIGYFYSPTFQQRVNIAQQEIKNFKTDPDTSVGMRLLFLQNSLEIIRKHPWLGVGTGDFQSAYAEINSTRSPTSIATDNPHNQYVLVGAMLGVVGIFFLLLIFFAMFVQAKIIQDNYQRIRLALPLFFLVIMLAESYLTVYQTAFFFVIMAAVLYKEKSDQRVQEFLSQ
ncbi:O-antigen ligase family protein, partial [Desulfobulbus sp. TB]|nr:O-antigen ligase family protein [Desulfobulbus sp. TB]